MWDLERVGKEFQFVFFHKLCFYPGVGTGWVYVLQGTLEWSWANEAFKSKHYLRRAPIGVFFYFLRVWCACGRVLKTTVQSEPCVLLPTKRYGGRWMGLQNVLLLLCHASADDVLLAPWRRFSAFGWFSIKCLFKSIAVISIQRGHSAHSSKKKVTILWESGNCAVRAQSFCHWRQMLELM